MIKKLLTLIAFGAILSFIPPTQQEDKIITLRLPLSKVNVVLKGVSKLPIDEAQDTYMTIIQQAQPQLADTLQKKK